MKDIKKKLVKQVKRSRPSLAQEIKDMPMKDFRALWFVVQQGLKIKNRFTGEETEMPGYAASVYDTIIGAERFEAWEIVRAGLDWFRKYFPKQYMVVLD